MYVKYFSNNNWPIDVAPLLLFNYKGTQRSQVPSKCTSHCWYLRARAAEKLKGHAKMEPRYNEPIYNEVLGITKDFLYPSNSKIYETEPRYNKTLPQRTNFASPLALRYIEGSLYMMTKTTYLDSLFFVFFLHMHIYKQQERNCRTVDYILDNSSGLLGMLHLFCILPLIGPQDKGRSRQTKRGVKIYAHYPWLLNDW